MKVRDGAWFLGKCSSCGAKAVMVRKLKASQVCIGCAERIILRQTGSREEVYGGVKESEQREATT